MRRTLKLLLVMGLAFVLQRPHGGGDGPDGPDDTTHNGPDGEGNSGKKTTTPGGVDASSDWGAGKTEVEKAATKGRAQDDNGDGQPDVPSKTEDSDGSTNTETPTLEPQYPDQWASPENLTSHYEDHRNDANAEWESEAEYREAAIDLMSTDGGRREGVRIKTDGDTSYFYDPATGEFGRSGPRGIITYYIPTPNPEAHFNRQPGTEV